MTSDILRYALALAAIWAGMAFVDFLSGIGEQ